MNQLHPNVEVEILAAVLKGEYSDYEILSYVDPGFFAVDSYKWLVRHLIERSWSPISWDFLEVLLTEALSSDSEKYTLYRNQLWHLYSKDLTFLSDASDVFKAFVIESTLKASIKSAWENKNKSGRIDYLMEELDTAYSKAKVLLDGHTIKIRDWASGYTERMNTRLLLRDNPDLSPVILTGIPELDCQVKIKGSMIVNFLAPMKSYKSIALNNIGFAALLQGFNVLHVVYENTIELTEARYDSLFSEISYDRLCDAAISIDEKHNIDNLMGWVDNWDSRLKIMKCIPAETTISAVEDQIDLLQLRENWVPDIVVLDYLNIVAPSEYQRSDKERQAKVIWDIKHLVDSYSIPCVTATQSNQEGNKAVKSDKRIDTTHQGKAIDISQGVDVTIAINQTNKEREDGIIMLCPLLIRDGDITFPEIALDSDIARMALTKNYRSLWEAAKSIHPY